MIDLCLRAPDEDALIEALPMLRGEDEHGEPGWQISGLYHALDIGFPVEVEPAILDEYGNIEKQAVMAEGFHANLRLLDQHPEREAILAACEPFLVQPRAPVRRFAGD